MTFSPATGYEQDVLSRYCDSPSSSPPPMYFVFRLVFLVFFFLLFVFLDGKETSHSCLLSV